MVPSANLADPTNESSTPAPNVGLPWVSRGGQFARQLASQLLWSVPSTVKMYRVIPLPSTRILPRVGSVVTLMTASLAIEAGFELLEVATPALLVYPFPSVVEPWLA